MRIGAGAYDSKVILGSPLIASVLARKVITVVRVLARCENLKRDGSGCLGDLPGLAVIESARRRWLATSHVGKSRVLCQRHASPTKEPIAFSKYESLNEFGSPTKIVILGIVATGRCLSRNVRNQDALSRGQMKGSPET